jgi:DNA-directed RNA polymerase specialized sigma24 family protein
MTDELTKLFTKRIKSIAKKFHNKETKEDFTQDMWVLLLTKYPDWEGTDFEFEKYMSRYIKRESIRYGMPKRVKQIDTVFNARGEASIGFSYVDIFSNRDDIVSSDISDSFDNSDTESLSDMSLQDWDGVDTDAYMDAREGLEVLKSSMSPEKFKTLELYYEHGYSCREIVEDFPELGFNSTSTVERFLNSFKK